MNPFLVQCETCGARLRVRDQAVVGQVHACLKCGSMVQLVPPPGWETPPPAAEATPPPSAPPNANHPADGAADAPLTRPVAPPAPDTAGPSPHAARLAAVRAEGVVIGPAAAVGAPGAPVADAAGDRVGAPDQPAAPRAEAAAKWAGVATAGGAATLLVAAGLYGWLTRAQPASAPRELAAAATEGAAPLGGASRAEFAQEAPPTKTPALPPPPSARGDRSDDRAAGPPARESPIPPNGVPPAPAQRLPGRLPPIDPPPVADPESSVGVPGRRRSMPAAGLTPEAAAGAETAPSPAVGSAGPDGRPADQPPASGPRSAPPAPFDPLDFDPASLDLILTRRPGGAPARGPAPPATEPPADRPEGRVAADLPEAMRLDERLGELGRDTRAAVRRGPTEPPPRRPADPLGVVAAEVAVADMPLDGFCRLMGQLAGAPITVDPTAIALAGVGAGRPITARATGATVGELLREALGPLRLEVGQAGGNLVLARTGAAAPSRGAYAVGDLAPGDATPLVELTQAMLPGLRAEVSAEGERIVVDGPRSAHLRVAILCERLRVARRLRPKTSYPKDLLHTEPAGRTIAGTLDRRATFSFVAPTPLGRVLDHLRAATGLTLVVDWRALADVELRPGSTILCSINERPWREAFSAVLGGLGLTWRPLGGGVIQVTTPAAAAASPRIEFYPADSAAAARQTATRLKAQAWRYDGRSGKVLLRMR